MTMYRKRTIGERLVKLVAGAYLGYVAFQGYALQPQVALIIGGVGVFIALSAFWKYEQA